jgi:hypothetical protein
MARNAERKKGIARCWPTGFGYNASAGVSLKPALSPTESADSIHIVLKRKQTEAG